MNIQTYHGATDYQNDTYSYTDGGNIVSITGSMRGHAYTCAYDDLHRLTNEAATSGSMAWTQDSIGIPAKLDFIECISGNGRKPYGQITFQRQCISSLFPALNKTGHYPYLHIFLLSLCNHSNP